MKTQALVLKNYLEFQEWQQQRMKSSAGPSVAAQSQAPRTLPCLPASTQRPLPSPWEPDRDARAQEDELTTPAAVQGRARDQRSPRGDTQLQRTHGSDVLKKKE